MTGTGSLIESSFCYDSGYPWQLVRSWALCVLAWSSTRLRFQRAFVPAIESNTLQKHVVLNGKLLQWEMWAGCNLP